MLNDKLYFLILKKVTLRYFTYKKYIACIMSQSGILQKKFNIYIIQNAYRILFFLTNIIQKSFSQRSFVVLYKSYKRLYIMSFSFHIVTFNICGWVCTSEFKIKTHITVKITLFLLYIFPSTMPDYSYKQTSILF